MDVNLFQAEKGKAGAVFDQVDFDDVGFHFIPPILCLKSSHTDFGMVRVPCS